KTNADRQARRRSECDRLAADDSLGSLAHQPAELVLEPRTEADPGTPTPRERSQLGSSRASLGSGAGGSDGFESGVDAEGCEETADVVLDRVGAQVQLGGDLLRRATLL